MNLAWKIKELLGLKDFKALSIFSHLLNAITFGNFRQQLSARVEEAQLKRVFTAPVWALVEKYFIPLFFKFGNHTENALRRSKYRTYCYPIVHPLRFVVPVMFYGSIFNLVA